eukprot:TRINITY_DN4818_c0_g1_i5.p1 TRINITY_DN4818_c0_g1~~TRINITY_DN4818_c0_g1_i5.p1  ORF type:complete len:165 (+),score=23.30 TRINITY_DN4818_c0_g1_i5:61-495(+)
MCIRDRSTQSTLKNQEAGFVQIQRILRLTGDHFYTSCTVEASTVEGPREGNIGYTITSKVDGSVPLYRYYNPETQCGDHFYTIYPEKELLGGYASEGIVSYVFSTPNVEPTPPCPSVSTISISINPTLNVTITVSQQRTEKCNN